VQRRGYGARVVGVTMQRPNEPGYRRPDLFVLDDGADLLVRDER
jgi:hypothetical protein